MPLILLSSLEAEEFLPSARDWITEMKTERRGPFSGIRWFCADGSTQPARGSGCRGHGGGIQHGAWSDKTRKLRQAGYPIATIYAALNNQDRHRLSQAPNRLAFFLLERFLVTFDDGWIYRQARNYRGAFQVEDETAAAKLILKELLADRRWRTEWYLPLREAVRLLPRDGTGELLGTIRSQATQLAAKDKSFESLRNKIHSFPEPDDAKRIREYARNKIPSKRRQLYFSLADLISEAYSTKGLQIMLGRLTVTPDQEISQRSRELYRVLLMKSPGNTLYQDYAELLYLIRERVETSTDPALALSLLETSIYLEQALFAEGRSLFQHQPGRAALIEHLKDTITALFGIGLISKREHHAAHSATAKLLRSRISARLNFQELRYLTLIPGWAAQQLEFDFGSAIKKFSSLEPLVRKYPDDRLRQSPLLSYSEALDLLLRDAARLSGLQHRFFGTNVGIGLRALSSGLARGVLVKAGSELARRIEPASAIYLVSETTSDLPPVAGIITAFEGNLLSHVQLLARNLGIPNIVAGENILPLLEQQVGQKIVMAATPAGRVEIAVDQPAWNQVLPVSSRQKRFFSSRI